MLLPVTLLALIINHEFSFMEVNCREPLIQLSSLSRKASLVFTLFVDYLDFVDLEHLLGGRGNSAAALYGFENRGGRNDYEPLLVRSWDLSRFVLFRLFYRSFS